MTRRVSPGERQFVVGGVTKGVREDGRDVLDLRHLVVENGVIEFCNGSTLIGRVHTACKVLAGVKVEVRNLEEVDEEADVNLFEVTVDCTSLEAAEEDSSPRRFREEGKLLTMQVEAQLNQMMNDRQTALEIVPNKFTWNICVDIVVLGTDGNLPDLISLAVYGALLNTKVPNTSVIDTEDGKDFEIDPDPSNAKPLPQELLSNLPLRVSLYDLGGKMIADASEREQACSACVLSVLVNRRGEICGTQIASAGKVKLSTLSHSLGHSCQIASELFKLLDTELK